MKLTFDGISSCWEEGIPLGNGRMGAVLCSEPETDVLYLNDDTLWVRISTRGNLAGDAGDCGQGTPGVVA